MVMVAAFAATNDRIHTVFVSRAIIGSGHCCPTQFMKETQDELGLHCRQRKAQRKTNAQPSHTVLVLLFQC